VLRPRRGTGAPGRGALRRAARCAAARRPGGRSRLGGRAGRGKGPARRADTCWR